MSDNLWDTDDGDQGEALKGARGHVKNLEKQLKELQATLETERGERAKLEAANRKSTLSTILAGKQAPARLARWIEKDEVEATEESVQKWLDENGEDFGYKPGQAQAEKPAAEDTTEGARDPIAALDESGATTHRGATEETLRDLEARFAGSSDFDGLIKEMASRGIKLGSDA